MWPLPVQRQPFQLQEAGWLPFPCIPGPVASEVQPVWAVLRNLALTCKALLPEGVRGLSSLVLPSRGILVPPRPKSPLLPAPGLPAHLDVFLSSLCLE